MSGATQLWYLEDVDLFDVMCPHKTKDMDQKHHFHEFKKDQFIYFENDPSDRVYLVASGRVKLGSYLEDGKEVTKAILGPGELFGELALTGEGTREDFAQAMDNNTSVCPMTLADMENLMKDNKPLNFQIFKIMGFRVKKLQRRVESLVFKDARTRIIEFLRDMALERGQKVGYEVMIKNHLTHKDIANLTGTSRQTVTTIMNELKEANLINFNRRQILIRDMAKLN